MLEDRDYMRQPEFREPSGGPRAVAAWPLTVWFLITYALVFIGQSALKRWLPGGEEMIDSYFALSNAGLAHGYVWQLVTYQFMHASVAHLILNGLAIYSFGLALERMVGPGKFIGLMLGSGIMGGLLQSAAAFIWPWYFSGSVVGASASAFGLVAAFAMLVPEQEITMYALYVFPVSMRAKTLLYVLGGLALAGFSFPNHARLLLGNVSHTAHLGGMLAGIFFATKIVHGNWFQPPPSRRETFAAPPDKVKKPAVEEYSMTEVDAILDKISAKGIGSLTARERELLERARNRIKAT